MDLSLIQRREFLAGLAGATAAAASLRPGGQSSSLLAADPPRDGDTPSGLGELAFRPLPLGSISPEGWLRRQLRLQADGLSGHLDEFWPDVGQSQWFGGKAEGWERAPYWLDGVIPLAWVLGDQALQAKVKRYVDHIVASQRPDGWYAPYPADASAKTYDLWSILLANKVLVQYHEATGDAAVLQAVLRNLKATLEALDRTPLFGWGKFRWFEGLIPVYYAYEQTGEAWLLDLARKLHAQGFDYMAFYGGEDVTTPTPRRGLWSWDKHVVNTAMALKAYALVLAAHAAGGRAGFPGPDAGNPGPLPRPGDRHVHRRRVPLREEPGAGHRAVRGGRSDVFAGASAVGDGRSGLRRPAGASRLQRPAGHLRAGHVVAPVRPAGQPGPVHDQPRSHVVHQRPGLEPLRPGAQLRLLHRQPAPGLAQVRRASLDADAGRGHRRGGLCAEHGPLRGARHARVACRSRPIIRSARRSS